MEEYSLLGTWFNSNKLYNPYTKRKIKKNKKTYNKLVKLLDEFIKTNSNFYINNRINNICPLSFEKLSYGYIEHRMWNSITGEFLNNNDPFGPLIIDVNYLVNYFYINRLRHIYTFPTIDQTGVLGDAIGKYPNFYLPGRGSNPQWYLFRLPINDCYIDKKNLKYITMGPKLSFHDIQIIYDLCKRLNTYHFLFNKPIPNIVEMYKIYHKIIEKCPYNLDSTVIQTLGSEYISQLESDYFIPYINKLIHFK